LILFFKVNFLFQQQGNSVPTGLRATGCLAEILYSNIIYFFFRHAEVTAKK